MRPGVTEARSACPPGARVRAPHVFFGARGRALPVAPPLVEPCRYRAKQPSEVHPCDVSRSAYNYRTARILRTGSHRDDADYPVYDDIRDEGPFSVHGRSSSYGPGVFPL